jgi:Icc-related predicted phosphoesterase
LKQRLYFATDIHGSDTCWRKFLRSAEHYDATILILGGDITGKALVPIVDDGGGRFHTVLQDQRHEFEGASELDRYRKIIRGRGLYPIVVTPDELAELRADEDRLDAAFRAATQQVIEEWVELADEHLAKVAIRCFMCPGNDDEFAVDDILRSSRHVEMAEGEIIDLGDGYQLASTGWANVTPWKTHREATEPELGERISRMLATATAPSERLIFNFHCPPHGTTLDEAPRVTEDLQIVDGGRVIDHVGSVAVREAIREAQPALSLHGHIHEARATARLGKTLAVNPGSSYEQGVLQGVVVELDGKRQLKRHTLTTG